ncbi:MAG: hypothetical protein WC359_13435 [Dehalococcoidia bacterium]|jgi:hypothetical protein
MKRLVLLLLLVLPLIAVGQTVVNGNYKAFAGTAADTLTTGVTKSYTLDLGATGAWSGKVYDITIQVWNDYVSDSLKFTTKVYHSVDGTHWNATATDSSDLVLSKADQVYYKTIEAQSARYWKVSQIAETEDQKSKINGYVYLNKH